MGKPLHLLNGIKWTPEDIVKKFGNTFIYGSVAGSVDQVLYLQTHDAGHFVVTSIKNTKGVVVPAAKIDLVEDRPDPCMSNCGNRAFYFCYRPRRQWRRGVCKDNARIMYPPFKAQVVEEKKKHIHGFDEPVEIVPGQVTKEASFTPEEAVAIFNPQHTSLAASIEFLNKADALASRAVSNDYLLYRNSSGELQLYRHMALLGSFLGKKYFVNRAAACLNEELYSELPEIRKYA